MYNRVFISHSKDDPNLGFFHKVFSGLNTKAIWMEFESITPPAGVSIANEIHHSDALFVLLSNELVSRPHTSSWVSFEIGLAARSIKTMLYKGIDIYVFEPLDNPIDFVVPYCDYYMLYKDAVDHIKYLKNIITVPLHGKGLPVVRCPYPDCQIGFRLLTDVNEFNCPVCRQRIPLSDQRFNNLNVKY